MYYITYNTLSTPLTLARFIHVFYFFWLFQHAYNEYVILRALYFWLLRHTLYIYFIFSFAKEFGHPDWQGYGSFIHRWTKRYGIVNKAICGSKESVTPNDELETWKETVLFPTLARYSPNDIYNGDETALFYKSLPHRTYCFDGDKPAGSAKCKDRLTTPYYHQHGWFRPQKVVSHRQI